MSDLLARLHALDPSILWGLAPRHTLMQGSGLLATGEMVDWSWTGTEQLEGEFPLRLDTLVCRLRSTGERLESACDCRSPQPCQHHVAMLMLAVHLLKDFNAFGRYPNRVLADRLRMKLGRVDASAIRMAERKREPVRHILIRPRSQQVFAYRLAFGPDAEDITATAPPSVSGFISAWTHRPDVEEKFWNWFKQPENKLPVFIDMGGGRVEEVKGRPQGSVDGELLLNLQGKKIEIRQRVLVSGAPAEEQVTLVGYGLAYLSESKVLAQLPVNASWYNWAAIEKGLTVSGIGTHAKKQFKAQGDHVEVETATWNLCGIPWPAAGGANGLHAPKLLWKGQPAEPVVVNELTAAISLRKSVEKHGVMDVAVSVMAGETPVRGVNDIVLLEDLLEGLSPDDQLLSARSRRDLMLSAIHRCWLAADGEAKNAIVKEVEEATCFKTTHQAKSAARIVKQFMHGVGGDESGMAAPLLAADPEQGWQIITGSLEKACEALALAREVLGAELEGSTYEYFPANSMVAELVLPVDAALMRLEKLVSECQARSVKLTFADMPVTVGRLNFKVKATSSDEVDWFELRAEVRCDGGLIPQEQWEEILASGHYIDENGALRVIDIGSSESLRRVMEIMRLQRGENDGDPDDELLRVPRLRILDWLALRKHGVECEIPEKERAVLESLLNFQALDRYPLPNVKATLREYQHDGYSWLAFLYKHGFGACLADDMGLGKTLQTITLLGGIKEGVVQSLASGADERRPHLLVVPPTLLFNWQSEIKHFFPGIYVHEYTGKGRSLIGIHEGVVITTYELARRDIDTLKEKAFDCVIFDEAQAVKNVLGERARAMRQLNGRFKLCLTGTPLENHAGEYYSIIDLALPGLFGERKSFLAELKNATAMFNPLDRARPFVLRRTKEKILKELPPKVESDIHLELTDEQKRFYTRAVGEVREEVLAAFKDKTAQQAGIVALAALTRLRQICVSPALIDAEYKECSPKLGYLCGKLEELASEGHAALVFSQFTRALDQLEKQLDDAGIPYQRLDGSTPQDKRKKLVEAYQKGTGPAVFLISLRAGGAGLNLTRASYVFHLDPWWNPAVEAQASDRAHRMGQKNTVFIQRLLMLHTVEEKIMMLKARKKELFDQVMNGSSTGQGEGGAVITKDDFRFLLE